MTRFLRWLFIGTLGVLGAALLLVAGLWLGTRGSYTVPALVTGDPGLPAATIAGHRLHLRVVDGPPGAETVVVLHGGPGGDFRSLQALEALGQSHRVVFYDQRGAGLSERVPAEALTLDGYLEELAAVIAHVAPGEAVSLIGHSWGAMLAAAYLGAEPERVTRAVLIEPGFLDAEGQRRWTEAARPLMSGPAFIRAAVLNGFRMMHVKGPDADAPQDFLIGRMVHHFASHPRNPYHCGAGFTAPGWRFGARASETGGAAPEAELDRLGAGTARFTGPVLFLAGACDSWLGAPLQRQHMAQFQNARLEVIPEAGHDVIWDNPAAALPVIRAFLTAKTR